MLDGITDRDSLKAGCSFYGLDLFRLTLLSAFKSHELKHALRYNFTEKGATTRKLFFIVKMAVCL